MIRVVHVYAAALVFTLILLMTRPPAQTGTQSLFPEGNEIDFSKDYWSLNCSGGMHLVINGTVSACEGARRCVIDKDCAYLEINSLPPRMGYCVNRSCRAYCGSGAIKEC